MKKNRIKKPKTVAYSFVMADLLHYGHIKLLKTARENADYHICGLISDEVCHLWQGINVCNYDERKAVLESLNSVDEVIMQESMDPTENLKAIRKRFPDAQLVVVHGDDWKTLPGREYIKSIGGRIVQPEYYAKLSRSSIVKKFKGHESNHPLKHEYFTRHFMVGNIMQFNTQPSHPMVSTKADTLKNFQSVLKLSSIERLFTFTVRDFARFQRKILDAVQEQFVDETIIVRSSSAKEDRFVSSNAGSFESVAGVSSSDRGSIRMAIKKVIESYKKAGPIAPGEQVLVQTQTKDIKKSGVIFTRNLETNTPYYMINYDDESGQTDTVTGGLVGKCSWLYRDELLEDYPEKWRALISSVREIEMHLPGMILDIEFAEKNDGSIIIFQIRPLAANVRSAETHDDDKFNALVAGIIETYKEKKEKLGGGYAFLSDMAFWNPSEIIGDNPHRLDYSIYREIITRSAWNRGLVPMGYTPVRFELMERFGNKPYINLDYSFMSLMPGDLSARVKKKLLEFYKSRLRDDLSAHDKIEFEIILSCIDFDSEDRLGELRGNGFSAKEVEEVGSSLTRLTKSAIKGYKSRLLELKKDLEKLAVKREKLEEDSEGFNSPGQFFGAAIKLFGDIERYATPQFTEVARTGFMSSAICKSLVNRGVFSAVEMNRFMEGISTVATRFDIDFQKYVSGRMSERVFLAKYGHLRAGTYDIRAPRYDRMRLSVSSDTGLGGSAVRGKRARTLDKKKLGKALSGSLLSGVKPDELMHFIRSSTAERELFKFEFTKSLSLALEFLARGGEELGFSREDIAQLDLAIIKSYRHYDDPYDLTEDWRLYIESMKSRYLENLKLILPSVIDGVSCFKIIDSHPSRPNFITAKRVKGEVVNLDDGSSGDINGKIVLLKKADPGFDWIFTKKIKGLITRYGGAASHMAIRSAEFNIAAAIGCGEQIYNMVSASDEITLDCRGKKILRVAGHYD